ncbi:phosphate ABC transporter permease subunit PstC [Streptomyces sp. RB110-1]|uniref:phosphate ABC transporter permease subunit PstC n=1 Tax=unclassified Streptomyces TaxID=2593676 RepID=UPI001901DEE5|nr:MULTISPECIES: phosphate ABC transporter permease subunit PstC [unclassified Streptomyces]MBK0372971.1 phosphate ABC transporter permease subunit PstC [Streptomyces sp. RB110-1]MBK0390661.1 phosphate ABC transporter permease subunit PstC [Streptomyces sp. RB110-2]
MTVKTLVRQPAAPDIQPRPHRSRWVWAWVASGAVSVAGVLLVLIGYLGTGVLSGTVDWVGLVTESAWNPADSVFGGLAMIYGSAVVCVIALLLAVPVGWAAAISLSEYLPPRLARPLRMSVELLAAVPSIVYGLIGIMAVRPFIAWLGDVPGGDSLLAAGIVLAVMITPTIVAVSVDALSAVPNRYREAAYSLGLTRREVVRAVVLPKARQGMRAGVLLGLARALGEAIAVFLVVGRADGRLPTSFDGLVDSLVRPGQTLTTKLAGPEPVLAGTSGVYFASICGLGLILLALVAVTTVWGTRRTSASGSFARGERRLGSGRMRMELDKTVGLLRMGALLLPGVLLAAMLAILATRGSAAFSPSFWFTSASGSAGGGVSDQILGTLLLIVTTGTISLPLGFGAGILLGVYASARAARVLQTVTVVVGGTPTILLGLAGFVIMCSAMGWGRSWLAGAIVLVPVVVPVVALTTAGRVGGMPAEMTESALALGLTRSQYIRSVVVPYAWPATVTGLLLGLARAAGETAPLLFTATVFFGAPALPGGIVNAPVQSLPTHIFTLSQDSGDPQAVSQAWGSALVLVLITAVLLSVAVWLRNRFEGERWTT